MSIEQEILGKWNFVSGENFDEYLKEVGVSFMTRKIASNLKPTLDFTLTGDEYTMTSVSTFKTHITKWKMGESRDGETADGRKVSYTFTVEGDKLIQEEKGKDGGKDSHFERYIKDGKLYITCTSGSVSATRIYEKAH